LVAAPQPGFVGMVKSSVAGCPNIAWRLARQSDGAVSGIAYYADASGTSQVTGTSAPTTEFRSGKINLKVTSIMGKGPEGTVTGQRNPNGGVEADLKGEGCANAHLDIKGVPNMGEATGS
jgi:hypothetical protein